MDEQADGSVDTVRLTFTARNARPVESKTLFALVNVEVQLAGVSFTIFSVQARRRAPAGTTIHLPTFENTDGTWRPAIALPEEVHGPLAEAVLGFFVKKVWRKIGARRRSLSACVPV